MSKFIYINHQNKGAAFVDALFSAGYAKTENYAEAAFLLSDSDGPDRQKKFERMRGKPVFLYPHAARPFMAWDGILTPWPRTTASFVCSEGQIEILRSFGYILPVHAVGWSLCPLRPFSTSGQYRQVLFAPIHPNANGWLSEVDKEVNRNTFERLLPLVERGEIDLTVRYLHTLRKCGLWEADRVTYVEGSPDQSYADIDAAEVIIAHQTFAFIAIARGKPCLMMGENIPPHCGNRPENFKGAKSWSAYRHLLMYPLDILAHEDTLALLKEAVASDEQIQDWRSRLIGEPFNPDRFIGHIQSYLPEPTYDNLSEQDHVTEQRLLGQSAGYALRGLGRRIGFPAG